MRKYTSFVRERLISFLASLSTWREKRIIAEYSLILGTSLIRVVSERGVGVSFVGVVEIESSVAKRSRDSKLTDNAASNDSSDGRMKSPGKTEEISAPPIMWPLCSIVALRKMRGLFSFLSDRALKVLVFGH